MRALIAVFGIAAALAVSSVAAAEEPGLLNPMRGLDKGSLSAFAELPLFDPTRRLPPQKNPVAIIVEAPAAIPPEPTTSLQVVGLVHGQSDIAIVRRDGAEKTLILRNDEKLGNWTVAVLPRGVTLRNGGRSANFLIFGKKGTGGLAQ